MPTTPTALVESLQVHSDYSRRRNSGDVYRTDLSRANELVSVGFVQKLDDVAWVSWDNSLGRILTPLDRASCYWPVHAGAAVAPKVLQVTRFDPGNAAYRYHSAYNTALGGTSAFVRFGHSNPFCDLRQFDGSHPEIRTMFRSADVVLSHMDYSVFELDAPDGLKEWPRQHDQLLVRHYHGSEAVSTGDWPRIMQRELDDKLGAVHIGARLYHHRLSDRMHWIPIPMPVYDYELLAAREFVPMEQRKSKMFRIAHSATNPRVKGTVAFQSAVQELQDAGLPVEAVLIMNTTHAEALRLKATCDATFDSFWLGIQGSGLEGAAMGHPVIAGDASVRDEYVDHLGECPYTFAANYEELKPIIERMVTDHVWRAEEKERVNRYVWAHHDYPVVGAKFWNVIAHERKARGLA